MGNRIRSIEELGSARTVMYHYTSHGKPVQSECELSGWVYIDHQQFVIDLIPIVEGERGQKFVVNLLVCGIVVDTETGLDLSTNPLCWLELLDENGNVNTPTTL